MTITAKIIKDSITPRNHRLTTMAIRYPRFIHAEAKTHRIMSIDDAEYELLQEISLMDDPVLSRNSSSSRAIPVEKMIQDVIDDPAMPVSWGANKPGMQAGAEHFEKICTPGAGRRLSREDAWLEARDNAVALARAFQEAGYHKQVANRLLEPFGHISVIVTATEWDNFFDLRSHPDADPTMRALSDAMMAARRASQPVFRNEHVPYISKDEAAHLLEHPEMYLDAAGGCGINLKWLISAARCARVSYLNHDGSKPDIFRDIALARALLSSKHMSPFEHQGAVAQVDKLTGGWKDAALQGNFVGWNQARKTIELLV